MGREVVLYIFRNYTAVIVFRFLFFLSYNRTTYILCVPTQSPKMFSHQDPANNSDIKQVETNDNPFQVFKIGSNYVKSCSGFLKIFALVINVVVFACIFLPSSSNIKDCHFKQYLSNKYFETIPCEDFPIWMEKLDFETNKKACDTYGSLELKLLKFEEVFANMTEAISKVGPFKTWILTPASSVWIQLVSLNGMFVTGMLLFLYLFNFVAKFSWNYFEVAFCCAMSFGYFTCGLHLILKGCEFTNQVTKCLFPSMDYFLTFGTAGFCFLGVFTYGIDGILKLRNWKMWCTSSEVKYQDQIN